MVRASILVLLALALAGAIVSLLPAPPSPPQGRAVLQDVDLALYPAADPDARWTFQAERVIYDPASQESVVQGSSEGKRLVNGRLDMTLSADEITIDSAENLRMQRAEVFVIANCITAVLGKPGVIPVRVDQTSGFRAPYADVRMPNVYSEGGPLVASFDFDTQFELDSPNDKLIESGERCVDGKIVPRPTEAP